MCTSQKGEIAGEFGGSFMEKNAIEQAIVSADSHWNGKYCVSALERQVKNDQYLEKIFQSRH
jgi:hypothetical protein